MLEIAAGPGDTGFLAARRLGSGRLVSTDIAQAMDLPDESFDAAICRWGFMLMPDPAAALRECRRVLKPGGRLVFAVFTGPEENQFASLPARVLVEAGHMSRPAPGSWNPGILALGDRARLQSLLDAAGFSATHVEPVDMTWRFAGTDAYWSFLVDMSAMGPLVWSLSDSAQVALRSTIDERLASFSGADGVSLPSRCWCGVAVR